MELTTLARACGKSDVHNLEPEDLVALTIEAAAMARIPLAGTDVDPGLAVIRMQAARRPQEQVPRQVLGVQPDQARVHESRLAAGLASSRAASRTTTS